MKKYTSFNWITSVDQKLQVNRLDGLFSSYSDQTVNLISIFGRARQGKSFLMNCLAGETEIFRVSNAKESCTQGIDISDKFLSLHDFSVIDEGKAQSGDSYIGFVDAEGQGDRDVTYDATLVCPILLASKCVIFNWKGDLQKDHLLETLGIMTKAAGNVALEADSTTTHVFSHLHIIFRDWNSIDGSAQSTFDALFNLEKTPASATRDAIRQNVLKSFVSVRVWLFDPPCEKSSDTRQRLNIGMTTPEFRAQVRELRAALALQLSEPTKFSGRPLKGKNMEPMIQQITSSLNTGEAVMPKSAFLVMVLADIQQIVVKTERGMRSGLIEHQKALEQAIEETSYITPEDQAMEAFSGLISGLKMSMEAEILESIGDLVGDVLNQTLSDARSHIETLSGGLMEQFQGNYSKTFFSWFRSLRTSIENDIKTLLEETETSIRNGTIRMTAEQLNFSLNSSFESAISRINCNGKYNYSGLEISDAFEQLTDNFNANKNLINELHRGFLEAVMRAVQEIAQNAARALESKLNEQTERLKTIAAYSKGYSISVLEEIMKNEQRDLLRSLSLKAKGEAHEPFLEEAFYSTTSDSLARMTVLVYEKAKLAALTDAASKASIEQSKKLQVLSSHIDMFANRGNASSRLDNESSRLINTVIERAIRSTAGWTGSNTEKQNFIVHHLMTSFVATYVN